MTERSKSPLIDNESVRAGTSGRIQGKAARPATGDNDVSIQFSCLHCAHALSIGDHKGGSTIHCPVCLGIVDVPATAPAAAVAGVPWWVGGEATPPTDKPTAVPTLDHRLSNPTPLTVPTPVPTPSIATPRPATEPPPSRKMVQPPPPRSNLGAPSKRRGPVFAAVAGGLSLLLLAGTLAALALLHDDVIPNEEPVPPSNLLAAGPAVLAPAKEPEEPKVETVPRTEEEPKPVPPAPEETKPERKEVPSPPEAPKEKPVEPKPVEPARPVEEAKPNEAGPPVVVVKRRIERTHDDLLKQVQYATELHLDRTPARAESAAALQAGRLSLVAGRRAHTTLALLDRRSDLAGLPLRRGDECRLTASATEHLDKGSTALRDLLTPTSAGFGLGSASPGNPAACRRSSATIR